MTKSTKKKPLSVDFQNEKILFAKYTKAYRDT